ncbi:hypothetical protein ASPBRDRAFT_642907 [Aspergillus brasiliensis CBS 101740]|uniref:Uncharacterized protein n=1 Tax=Aspergillus brasiliensis (strain CBS 101740 / IMI 381727 / IBT 21946) TaxID=767769 RepID=A0A1L9UE12_ASPBC|nr:hypothetical protein ASPBRDRAFT_642907 [Aspergillus brasiliensis CBS 101740]
MVESIVQEFQRVQVGSCNAWPSNLMGAVLICVCLTFGYPVNHHNKSPLISIKLSVDCELLNASIHLHTRW